jgi:hypothetical protein
MSVPFTGCDRPQGKIPSLNLTKMFHVKHFCKIGHAGKPSPVIVPARMSRAARGAFC